MSKKVGLVTVLFNCPEVLPDFFFCLSKQTYSDYNLYIIDNSTNDDSFVLSKNLIEKYQLCNVEIIKNTKNVGVAAANNQGIHLALNAGCEYVLLLNNDIEFHDEQLLEGLLSYADNNKERIIVPKMRYFDNKRIWCAGGCINLLKGTTTHYGDQEVDNPKYNNIEYTEYAPTCFMLIHADVFSAVGFMDEDYFVYYDDTDFVYRFKHRGFKILYNPNFCIDHKVSSSTGGDLSPFSMYYSSRNRVYFVLKNFGLKNSIIPIAFMIVTRPLKSYFYNSELRSKLISGMIAGFRLYFKK